jgi:hypothetical protein
MGRDPLLVALALGLLGIIVAFAALLVALVVFVLRATASG